MEGRTEAISGKPYGYLEYRNDDDGLSEITVFILDADKVIAFGESSLSHSLDARQISRFQVAVDYRGEGIEAFLFEQITADTFAETKLPIDHDGHSYIGDESWEGKDAATFLANWDDALHGLSRQEAELDAPVHEPGNLVNDLAPAVGVDSEMFSEPWKSFIEQMAAEGTPVGSLTLAPEERRLNAKTVGQLADEGEAILLKYASRIRGFETASAQTILKSLFTDLMHSVARSGYGDFDFAFSEAQRDQSPGSDDGDSPTALRRGDGSDLSRRVSSNQRASRGDTVLSDEIVLEKAGIVAPIPLHAALVKLRYAYDRAEGTWTFDEVAEEAFYDFEFADHSYGQPSQAPESTMHL